MVVLVIVQFDFFFSSRRRHTRSKRDWSSDVCSSDLGPVTLDPQVGAAVREIADVPGESAGADGPGTSTGADGTGEPGAPRAALDGDRLTLHPGAPDAEVSVVTLPRRG